MIDPEFWSDQEIGFWSFEARLFYIGLWNFSDDEGRFKAHDALLRSQIFPYELKINIKRLKLEISDKVQWYEFNGQQYGFIRNFSKHQRIDKPTESKLPKPPKIEESSYRILGDIPPNTTKEKLIEVKITPIFDFEEIWSKYPRKLGKDEAFEKFKKQVQTKKDYEDIKNALDNFLRSPACKTDIQYIPHGSTWFNKRWRDYIDYKDSKIQDVWPKHPKSCPECFGNGYMIAPGSGGRFACREPLVEIK